MRRNEFLALLRVTLDMLPDWHCTNDGDYYCIAGDVLMIIIKPNTVVIQDENGGLSNYGITSGEYSDMMRLITPKTEIDLPESERLLITPGNSN